MKTNKFKVGQTVTITGSKHSGVNIGEEGVVDCIIPQQDGYGVAFDKSWPETFVNEKPPKGKRVLFFEESELK
jgi:hypothetical protein